MKQTTVSVLALLAISSSLRANYESSGILSDGWGLGAQAGIQGVGLHLRKDIGSRLYLKLEGNYFDYSDDVEIDDIDFDGHLDFSNVGLTLNWLPFESSGFRITGGAYHGNNSFRGRATSAGKTVDINGTDYRIGPGDFVRGSVEFDSISPYFGIGWDWLLGANDQFTLGLDLGVLYLGDPSVKLATSPTIGGMPVPGADLEAERRDIASEIEDYKFLPVLKVSFTYRF